MPKAASKSPPAFPPVMVLAGEETFLRNQVLIEVQSALFGDQDPGMGLIRLDPATLGSEPLAVILDEVRTPSMFAPKKLVIVEPADALFKKNPEEDDSKLSPREILENYLEALANAAELPPGLLVLAANSWLKTTRLHKAIEKMGGFRLCEPIKEQAAPGWIARRAKEAYGKTIDPAAAGRLAELIGPDLQRLDNELAKLSLYEPDAPAISTQAVDALVGFQHEQQIWDMINAIAAKDAATALKKIDELWALDSKIVYTATGAVFSWLGQVLKARELVERRLPDAVIGRELRLWPPDRAQSVLALARSWGIDGAARWSQAILKMDLANKSSLGEPRRNLERFVAEICSA